MRKLRRRGDICFSDAVVAVVVVVVVVVVWGMKTGNKAGRMNPY